MKYVTIFHANLSYAYLTPDRYEFVIRESYELILDVMKKKFPDVKFVFEASGYTVEQIALHTPDVLKKLVEASPVVHSPVSTGQRESARLQNPWMVKMPARSNASSASRRRAAVSFGTA